MRTGRGSIFHHGAAAPYVPRFNAKEITDSKSASWIVARVGEATLGIASCLRRKFGPLVSDFGFAILPIHKERQSAFSVANPDVPAPVLLITDNKVDI